MFKAEEWDNFGLITVNSSLIYSIIDVLLGGRRGQTAIRVEGRPYTTIESNLVKRMIEVVLADAELAFKPLSPVKFNIDRLETNPRFAAISRPANAAILVRLRIDMEDRGGNVELLLPYATIEPIRDVLLQMFMGEKFGRDPIWEGHLATEIGQAEIAVDAVLYEAKLPLRQLMQLEVGDTLMLEIKPDALVTVRCGDVTLTEGRMGRVGDRVAVRVGKPLRKPRTTLAMFEGADASTKPDGGHVSYGFGLMIESLVAILLLADDRLLRASSTAASSGSGRRAVAEGDDRRADHRDRDRRARGRRAEEHRARMRGTLGERLQSRRALLRRARPAGRRPATMVLARLSRVVVGRRARCDDVPSGRADGARSEGGGGGGAVVRGPPARARGRAGRMIRLLRDFRLIPVVLVAITCLFVLKSIGLIFDGGYTLSELRAAPTTATSPARSPQRPTAPAAPMPTAPTPPRRAAASDPGRSRCSTIPTSPVGRASRKPQAGGRRRRASRTPKRAAADAGRHAGAARRRSGMLSPAERAILERLAERRTELEARARELEMRESLLQGRGEAARRPHRPAQGARGADQRRDAAPRTRARPRASRTSSPCTRT